MITKELNRIDTTTLEKVVIETAILVIVTELVF